MKTVNVTFTDEEYQKLSKSKGENNWHDFILILAED
jgi:predicted CopG family antitoxin